MSIVLGIDGTGPFFDSTYATEFKNSFVRRICPEGNPNKKYFRGPIGPGGGLPEAIQGGYDFITGRNGWAGRDNSILLTGYSRGGLGVLVVANMLKDAKIPVAAMLLFDAVDRHVAYDAPTVPTNVAQVLHIRRSPESGSRISFGNCGTGASAPTVYREVFYNCTHGGVGGTPWESAGNPNALIHEGFPDNRDTHVTYAQDRQVSAEIWAYVQPFIQKYKFV